jgi:acyl-CoA synthetase (NDP forming)
MGLATPPLKEETLRMARQGLPPWASFDNPADIWAALEYQGVGKGYETVLRAMALQDDIDMLMAIFTIAPQFEIDVAGIMGGLREEFPEKPLIACILGSTGEDLKRWFDALEGEAVPVYESVERAMTAARALNTYASYLRAVL